MEYTIENVILDNITEQQHQEILNKLDTMGLEVVVLSQVFTDDECDQYVSQSVDWLSLHLPPLTRDPKTWTTTTTPSGPRKGMYQSLIGHSPVAWTLRERMYPLFVSLHGTSELITSIDGATIFPPVTGSKKDWPHIDQTTSESKLVSFQGQVVLTNTTASFRCTPKSHLKHEELVKEFGMNAKSQWYKFSEDDVSKLAPRFEQWQIPIHTKKGSVILWRSTTIHSAKYVDDPSIYQPETSWDGWRCVYYCVYETEKTIDEKKFDNNFKCS